MEFNIQTMTCGGCAGRITKAIQTVDPKANVSVDLPSHRIVVQSHMDRPALVQALTKAGYPPQ